MKISPDLGGFFKAWLIFFLPGIAVSAITHLAHVAPPESRGFALDLWLLVLSVVFVAPALETLVLVASTAIAKRFLGVGWRTAIAGAVPIALCHFADGGWAKVAIVFWAFTWSAYCYLRLTSAGISAQNRFLFLFGIHALGNAVIVCIARLM